MTASPSYRAEYRVRFDEADADGLLRPSGYLRYAQDMAWRHSEEAGYGRDFYASRGMHWLVRNVHMSIDRRVTYGDVLTVTTQVTGWRAVWARRESELRRIASSASTGLDERVATVRTDWVLLTIDGRPARVPARIAQDFASAGPFTRDRIVLPGPAGGVTELATRVRPLDVDPMRHMNNAAYLDVVDDAMARMPADAQIGPAGCYRVGYVRPALPGTAIVVRCWSTDAGAVACRISDADGSELTRALVGRSPG